MTEITGNLIGAGCRSRPGDFSKRVADGDNLVHVEIVDEVGFSDIGWWFAQAARLIGGALPTGRDSGVPMIVTVTEDGAMPM